uniref:Uncharacterized protein n=1 Tax=Hippocampus comes TaxID=109280 RepID=A0A3Q2XJI4_HIPCM
MTFWFEDVLPELDWWHVQGVSHLLPKRQLGNTPSPPPHCDLAHESAEAVTDVIEMPAELKSRAIF